MIVSLPEDLSELLVRVAAQRSTTPESLAASVLRVTLDADHWGTVVLGYVYDEGYRHGAAGLPRSETPRVWSSETLPAPAETAP